MTLVVARVANDLIAMVGDTNLILSDTKLPLQNGTVKVCPLPGGICVGYCNSPELAVRDINKFIKNSTTSGQILSEVKHRFGDVTDFFVESSRKTGNDYLLAFGRSGKLVKISNGVRVETQSKTVWIGDKQAFELFSQIRKG